jgi:hypothetical protein
LSLTYWHSGGDIVGPDRQTITPDQAGAALARLLSPAASDLDEALRLADEIEAALTAQARWRRAALTRFSHVPRIPPGY